MNQPPPTRPVSRQRPPAPRRRTTPPLAPRRQVPWTSLTIWGLAIGVGAGIYIQIDRWLHPMFETPPPPPFLAETPIGTSPSSSTLDSGAGTESEGSQAADVAANSDNEDGATTSSDAATSSEANPSSDAIATEPLVDDVSPDVPLAPEPVANSTARGRVVEPIGLAIRADPSVEAAYLGGLAFNETVTVLESSGDGRWQRVRRDFNGLEGWIKAGNIEEIE